MAALAAAEMGEIDEVHSKEEGKNNLNEINLLYSFVYF